jgi:Kdo2-lipid IVA lauroyltransferase/acyltransferase
MTDSASPDMPQAVAQNPSARDRLEATLLRWARRMLRVLPLTWASRAGAVFGWFLFRVTGFQRTRALHNLDVAFDKTFSPRERWAIARRCYQHFGSGVAEFLSESRFKPGEIRRHMTLVNPELLREALSQGKGVLLVTSHFGSWELLGPAVADAGFAFSVFTGGQRNLLVEDQINAIRTSMGMHGISREAGARALLRALKARHVVGLISDQHESTKRHYVSFFGQPVSVAPGPYALARHTGAPVLYGTTVRTGVFRYQATFEMVPGPDASVKPGPDEERDLLEFEQRLFAKLERDTRTYPDHYFWMHRRFRPIPTEVTLSPVNRAFLEGRLSGPVDSFWERLDK